MKIILLSGFAGAGKDTLASVLCKYKGYQRFAFADPIKELVSESLKIPLEYLHSPLGKQRQVDGKTLRQYCIDLGEAERQKDPEVWSSKIAKQIKESTCKRVVISDWRHLPELFGIQKAFPDAFIVPIRICCSSYYISSVPDATEYALIGFPFPFTIQNSRMSEDELLDQINCLPL